jgi:Phage tail tube protein
MTQSYIPAGLGETFGLAAETTVGTFATPTRWIPHKTATFNLKKGIAQSEALRGSRFLAAPRRVLVSHTVDGSVELELQDRQFGLLLAHCVGSSATATQEGSSTLYLQTITPGFLEGQSFSFQKTVPFISGTSAQSMSYEGCKITDWTISVQRGGLATLALTIDSWNEDTSQTLTAPTYLSGTNVPNLLNWSEGYLYTGGTVSTTSGVTSISGNTAPTGIVSSISIKGTNVLAGDRYQIGSTTKKEQLTNGFSAITGEVEIEFATLADFYTAFAADTSTALQVHLSSPTTSMSYTAGLDIILPSIKWEGDSPNASGPAVIKVKVPFTALDDEAGDPVIQFQYISLDTTP